MPMRDAWWSFLPSSSSGWVERLLTRAIFVAILLFVRFRWNAWNSGHIAEHGISESEAQFIVNHTRAPYPQMVGAGKRLVIGQSQNGAYVQVIYVLDENLTAYVIHARPLTDSEKRRYRRRRS